jgi:hypothetical protein
MRTPKTKQYCWYCGDELITTVRIDPIKLAGGSTQYPSFIMTCSNHEPSCMIKFCLEELTDYSLQLVEVEIVIEDFISAYIWLLNDEPFWCAGDKIFDITNDMLKLHPDQLVTKIKKLLPFI